MEQETIVLTAILVIALVGRLFVQSVPGITKINMALQVVSLVVQENIRSNPQKMKSCSPGKVNNNSTMSCENCDEGYFQNEYGKTSCKDCGTGFFQRNAIAKIAQLDNTKTKEKK